MVPLSRRSFLVVTVLAGFLVLHVPAGAQQPGRVYRVGYLGTLSTPAEVAVLGEFRQALGELGWIEGRNLAIERRYSEGFFDRFPQLAAELVRLKVDVITTAGGWSAVRAAKQASATTPIVMLSIADPVAVG